MALEHSEPRVSVGNADLRSSFPEWLEIFSTGTWTDSAGNTKEWTLDDLEEIALAYDSEKAPAPIVVGHPEMDSPAYGWIESLKIEGEKLLAKPMQLVNEFVDWVKKGLYKKISIAIYPDMTLKHVGFLGGAAPAVKGLKPVSFAHKKAGWTFEREITMTTTQNFDPDKNKKGGITMTLEELWTKIEGLFKVKEKTNDIQSFTEAEVQAREAKAKKDAEAAAFAENEKLKKEKAEAEAKVKEIEIQARKTEIAAFCEAQCKEGRLTPALRKIIEPAMIAVAGDETVIEFTEPSGVVKRSKLQVMQDFVKAHPKLVTFSEVAGDDKTKVIPKDFDTAVEGVMKEQKISRAQAIKFCAREYPELHDEYVSNLKPAEKK